MQHITLALIQSFGHKGLERFFRKADRSKIAAGHEGRIRRLLDRLDGATRPEDMNTPGYHFHELKGIRKGTYSVSVSGNWRITFRFHEGHAIHVNLEDYH